MDTNIDIACNFRPCVLVTKVIFYIGWRYCSLCPPSNGGFAHSMQVLFFQLSLQQKLVLMDVSNASWAYNKGFKIKYGKCNHLDNDKIWVMQYGHVEHEFHSRCKHCFLVYIVNEPQSNIVFIHTQPSYLNIVYHFYIAYFNKYVIMSTKQSPML